MGKLLKKEKTISSMEQTAMRVSKVSIIVNNLLLSIAKLAVGLFASSGAMVSDAIHSASEFPARRPTAAIHTATNVWMAARQSCRRSCW